MKLFDDSPDIRWLFCMTHPDDEISIAAWICHLARSGREVWMSWTHDNPIREAEARRFAGFAGVPQDRLTFHHVPDQGVADHLKGLAPAFKELMARTRPDRVVCGAFEQGHIDHDATNFLVNLSFAGPVLEVPFYHTYLTRLQIINRFSVPAGEEVLLLDERDQELKLQVAKMYPSQNIWSLLIWYEIWQAAMLRPAHLIRSERLRLQEHKDFREPNVPSRLKERVKASPIWRRWIAALDQFEI